MTSLPQPTGSKSGMEPVRKRSARACVRCRQQKSKCNLDQSHSTAGPPCQRCLRAGAECVLGTSNRGRRRMQAPLDAQSSQTASQTLRHTTVDTDDLTSPQRSDTFVHLATPQGSLASQREWLPPVHLPSATAAIIEDRFASTNLHNTSDSLDFLSKVAGQVRNDSETRRSAAFDVESEPLSDHHHLLEIENMSHYRPIQLGLLSAIQVIDLVDRFSSLYHAYYPITPRDTLRRNLLHITSKTEPHLLTAIITIAARDLPGGEHILATCTVEAVEALLLIAEWEPHLALRNSFEIGCGDEDNAAFMHIGLALRLGVLLKLDQNYNEDPEAGTSLLERKRLAWAACFLSDRQISIRLGRALSFPSPGINTENALYSFPSLQPQSDADNDQASVFRARLELTLIFSDVHEKLYSRSQIQLESEFNLVDSTLDAIRASISTWKRVWGTLTCSQNIKVLLQMSYEYLRLYTNAYAFETCASCGSSPDGNSLQNSSGHNRYTDRRLPHSRFIDDSLDAARSLLTIANNFIPTNSKLSYYPMRFSLYCINAAVFLYKAWSLHLLSAAEEKADQRMIADFIERLQKDNTQTSSLGSRYARLLGVLWRRAGNSSQPLVGDGISATSTNGESQFQNGQGFDSEFSWLDLQAVSEFLSGGSEILAGSFAID